MLSFTKSPISDALLRAVTRCVSGSRTAPSVGSVLMTSGVYSLVFTLNSEGIIVQTRRRDALHK